RDLTVTGVQTCALPICFCATASSVAGSSEATKRLLSLLPATELAVAQKLLGYPESSVGRMMTPQYVAVRQEWTCGEAIEEVRRRSEERRGGKGGGGGGG